MTTLQEVVNNISYRPGWKLRLDHQTFAPNVALRITASVQCAYEPHRTIPLHSCRVLPIYVLASTSEKFLVDFCFRVFRDMEMHELGEFFQYKGKRPFDPHHNESNR